MLREHDRQWPPKPGELWEAIECWGAYDKDLPKIRTGDVLLIIERLSRSPTTETSSLVVLTQSGRIREIAATCRELKPCNTPAGVV